MSYEEIKLRPGWLQRQFARVTKDVAAWPEWMKREAGLEMRTKHSFDEKCYELAEYFMREPAGKWTDMDRTELAELIQRIIEDFMKDDDSEGE